MPRSDALKKVFVLVAICMFAYSFVIPVSGAFSSVIITDVKPTELHPGSTSDIILTVKNSGGRDARDVRLAFQSQGTEVVSLVGPTVAQINTLNSWCWKEVEIKVHVKEEAPNGVYYIPITCSWDEYYFIPGKGYVSVPKGPVQLGISFNIQGRVIMNVGAVSTDPTDVKPGDEDVKITAFIENSGEAAAKDIEVNLLCNAELKPSWTQTDRSYIGRLNSGDSKEAIFYVDVADGIESKMYSIPLRIKYKDTKNVGYEVMRSIDILVKPKPEFEIASFYTEPANISAGDYVTLYAKIRNVGSEKAESVSVRSIGEAEVPFDFDVKSDYIGNLEINEEGTAILKFDIDKDATPKEYQQGLEIRCTGDRDLGDDNVYIDDKMISLSVSPSSSRSIPGFGSFLSLIAIALLFVFFFFIKKR